MNKFYNMKSIEALDNLNSDKEKGLTSEQVKLLAFRHGKNEFTPKEEESIFDKIKDGLTEPMILILIGAAILSMFVGEIADGITILGAIALGIGIGIVTEGKSSKAANALSKMTADIEVKALRNGKVVKIHKTELVPGDIIYLETGDMVPADGRLVDSLDLKVREDMLTGESDDVSKKHDVVIDMVEVESNGAIAIQEPIPAKQINMVFGGTLIASGRATMIVTTIGDATQMGEIAQNLTGADEETPLQAKLGALGAKISKVSFGISAFLFIFVVSKLAITGTFTFDSAKDIFIVCIALLVAAVPEGLPTMVNMTLAITMQKMAQINALVTKKEACETIGSVSVICSDKTGTLTENRMTVAEVIVEDETSFMNNCLLNSTADLEFDENNKPKYMGSATECALLLHYKHMDYRLTRKESNLVAQEQFSSATKMMSTTVEQDGVNFKYIKGAPEVVMALCEDLSEESINTINEGIQRLQKQSMRVLGFACEVNGSTTFTGFVGIKDPLRDGVETSVRNLKKAGVSTKMLTGDNIVTATAIGNEIGLLEGNMRAVEATYIDTLTDEELRKEIQTIGIVARSKPDTKMRIVQALQKNNEVVAVTGDGINDAPALSKADVGIAMGIAGTEVSKGAADIILADDSFSTIEKAVKWGRGIYDNFQRFLQFQLTVNIVAFLIAILCTVMGKEMPFTTIQLLWVNIIMDGPPALALGLEPVREAVLGRRPTDRKASILTKSMEKTIVLNALFISAVIMAQESFNFLGATNAQMGTVLFSLFAFSALFNALNAREFGKDSIIPNFFKNKLALQILGVTAVAQIIFTNVLKEFFNCVALSPEMWVKVILTSSLVVIVNEVVKFVARKIAK